MAALEDGDEVGSLMIVDTIMALNTGQQRGDAMTHFYRDVPGLGNVAISRHAQQRAEEDRISQEAFDRVLLTPIKPDIPDGADILWRERDGIRLVILTNPTPNTGAMLVKTVYRIEAQARAQK